MQSTPLARIEAEMLKDVNTLNVTVFQCNWNLIFLPYLSYRRILCFYVAQVPESCQDTLVADTLVPELGLDTPEVT